ncbi:hypothetical protein Sjap_012057 [Stephania japonica]|uniref:DNA-directed RNA polymerase subunit n=1 Tax=Stephania japonica TaxID=461633 RepID=A0AAP0JDJ0_9MAGN
MAAGIEDGRITSIHFSLAADHQISAYSISDCPITHSSQLTNSFLGLPLESGKCDACGTAEPGQCEGHFGYIDLPIPVFHPSHLTDLRKLLALICLKCLRLKKPPKDAGARSSSRPCSHCIDVPQIAFKECTTKDGAQYLELKVSKYREGLWSFLDKYGYHYDGEKFRQLLPCEVLEILRKVPEETRKRLRAKGCFPQDGYILQKLPVPPNCLSVPDVSDGKSVMSSDLSVSMLRKVLRQVDVIKNSRSGPPSFEAHVIEANDLQLAVAEYLNLRGVAKAPHNMNARLGANKESDDSSTRVWLEKMRTLFIRKGSGFSSRSVLSGDAYQRVDEIGLPLEIAQRITFEEKVTERNKAHLQDLVDKNLCLTYKDGASTYSLREGSKGHTLLRVGQLVHRRIMDGDIVFINRTPSTHKHSLQAFSIYVHSDHTVKINPLICGPFGADFDGDCVQLYYPQSLAAKAEALELFSVEQQLLSSHSANLNLQLVTDALLSLKIMFKIFFFDRPTAQQLVMSVPSRLQGPAVVKVSSSGSQWTVLQILQCALPSQLDCSGDRFTIRQSEILRLGCNRDLLQALWNEIISTVFYKMGSKEALNVFNSLQPLLMENIFLQGCSISLKDFIIPKSVMGDIKRNIEGVLPLLNAMNAGYDETLELQVDNQLKSAKLPIANFILKLSALAELIDAKSESSISKVVQQVGFMGVQLSSRGKFYSRILVNDMASLFKRNYAVNGGDPPPEAFGLITSCLFNGLDPYEAMVHSISSREVLVRSSRGLAEPGTLFKNLMAILRDVIICYDGTVRNVCSNFLIQFEYGSKAGTNHNPAGEAVGVLAATSISNPAYKAVLDSSPSSYVSWELMKEVLLCRVNFKNDITDRRVILFLNDCGCGKRYCKENAAYVVWNQLKGFSLKDIAPTLLIEYQQQKTFPESSFEKGPLVGHIHFDKKRLKDLNLSMHEVLLKCRETISSGRQKKKDSLSLLLKKIFLSVSECCCFHQSCDSESPVPCLQFSWMDPIADGLEKVSLIMANIILPVLLETVVKGDPRVEAATIIWVSPDASNWVRNPGRPRKGETAVEVVLKKAAVKGSGDAWRIVMDTCLPVFHLIDTKRSIPHAIKQVQELVGISCAFDQVVERLSRSVKMVAKGVLKDHLLLLASSMTCTGNVIGFYVGGYKALFRSLKIHVPFAEATLFTPRKCFERAAEKCHVDSLSSIVASCSWGKHVAVGTGTRFELCFNRKEIGANDDNVKDVFSFLHLVRMGSNEKALDTTCLGGEIDDFDLFNEEQTANLSPEHDNDYGKPIFDDGDDEIQRDNNNDGPNWEINSFESGPRQKDGEQGWNSNDACADIQKPDSWGGWGRAEQSSEPSGDAWSNGKSDGKQGWNSKDADTVILKTGSWSGFGKADQSSEPSGDAWSDRKSNGEQGWISKGAGADIQKPGSWSSFGKADQFSEPSGDAWSDRKSYGGKGWNSNGAGGVTEKTGSWGGWGKAQQSSEPSGDPWLDKKANGEKGLNSNGAGAETQKTGSWGGWGKADQSSEPSGDAWLDKKTNGVQGWNSNDAGAVVNKSGSWGAWGKAEQFSEPSGDAWSSRKTNAFPTQVGNIAEPLESPRRDVAESLKKRTDVWEKQHEEVKDSGWSNKREDTGQWKKSSLWSSSDKIHPPVMQESTVTEFLGTNMMVEQASQKENKWDSSIGKSWSESEVQGQWGARKGPSAESNAWDKEPSSFKSRAWKTDVNLGKGKKPRESHGWNDSGVVTATYKRLDQFTSEEQDILSDVEPIMLSIKRIWEQTRDKDGVPLPPEDKSFVLDNVFSYHPDKAGKTGSGVDYITVKKHASYQDSRCFYVVSTDGRSEDFSHRKCLENFIRTKYPEKATSFIDKYFRKPQRDGKNEKALIKQE